jgi:EAL domain-containing protein (putative c-di-GMP-specific phosphodiesterase class I)
VETEAEFAFLKNAGCNLIQGYLLGRPMSAEALMQQFRDLAQVAA